VNAKRALHGNTRRVARCPLTTAALGALCLLRLACADDAGPDGASSAGAGSCPMDLPTDADCPAAAPRYGAVIADIVEQRCQSCHYPQNPFSSEVFDDYSGLFEARRTALSQVYGCRMPPPEAPQLRPEERGALLKWFVCGAPQN
jgi:hypothetical protein